MSRFLDSFERYFQALTDAPLDFGHTAGLSCLSTVAMGRRWLQKGASGIHPNLFWLLTAESSEDRKTTSVNAAKGIIETVAPERIGPTDFTPEGLADWIAGKSGPHPGKRVSRVTIYDTEYSVMLSTMKKSYGLSIPAMLCQLYDGEDYAPARRGATTPITDTRLSVLGACAFGMLEQYADPIYWTNGLWARYIFITPQHRRTKKLTQPNFPQTEYDLARAALADLNRELKAIRRPFATTQQAEALYSAYATSVATTKPTDPVVSAQRERYLSMVWKAAILYQIDEDPANPIGPNAMNRAIGYMTTAWQAFVKTYAMTAGSQFARTVQKVAEVVKAAGPEGYSKRDLLRNFRLQSAMLTSVLDILVGFGAVEVKELQPTTGGRPKSMCVHRGDIM